MRMKKKLKAAYLGIILLASFSGFFVIASPVQAAIKSNICGGAELTVNDSGCTATLKDGKCVDFHDAEIDAARCKTEDSLNNLITNIVNILSVIVGIVAVIMIILGGFKYITSGGDSGNITSAKNTIVYAIVGLIIVALAQVIVRFVLAKTT